MSNTPLARQYERLLKELEREKDKTSALKEAMLAAIKAVPPQKLGKIKSIHRKDQEGVVLDLSDWHIGERVDRSDVYGRKPYNLKVMKSRAKQIVQSTKRLLEMEREAADIDELLVVLGGDMFAGENIFRGQSHTIELPVLNQILIGVQVLVEVLNQLSTFVPHIRVVAVPGNHGRLGKPGEYNYKSNLETLFLFMVKETLSNCPRIEMSVHAEEIVGLYWHKHQLIIGHGGHLARGTAVTKDTIMQRASVDWPGLLRKKADIILIHHWHEAYYGNVRETDIFINGSLVGANHFSCSRLRSPSPPKQWLFGVHPKRITFMRLLDFV